MSNVEFETDQITNQEKPHPHVLYGKFEPSAQTPGMIKFLMTHGVKTEKAANAILLFIVFLAIAMGIFVYLYFVLGSQPKARSFDSYLRDAERGSSVPLSATPKT
jgi:hypothetical protein